MIARRPVFGLRHTRHAGAGSRILERSRRVAALFVAAALLAVPEPAMAQGRLALVRDAEIEALVRDYARPILKVAGLATSGVEIVLVNDPGFNAFVAGRRIFINTGTLMIAETPNEVIGVLAHEAGHIAGGHQERLREQLARAQTMMVVGTLLGAGAIVAGAATKTGELGQAGAGIAAGTAEVAQRGLLGYQRTEETTADRSALTYLNATGQSAKGMLTTFKRFQSALSLSGARIDPYRASHPMPRDRIANLETLARESPNFDQSDSPTLQLRHDMARAKIAVFTQGQAAASRLFRKKGGLPAQYGEAVAAYLLGNPKSAVTKVDALIKVQPKNPYFYELRGDSLLKANRPAEAAEAYATAIKLDPAKSGILEAAYGQALLTIGTDASLKKAVAELRKAVGRDPANADGYRNLAQAYGQLGETAAAELAMADAHYYNGRYKDARSFAARAQRKFKRGTPEWIRAQDIINYRPISKK